MKRFALGLALAGGIALASGHAAAAKPEDLLKSSGCTACHATEKKLVGPAYKEVAKKYAGDKEAPKKLAEHVRKGGAGVWGQVPMPPHPQLKQEDLDAMIKYILSLK